MAIRVEIQLALVFCVLLGWHFLSMALPEAPFFHLVMPRMMMRMMMRMLMTVNL